TLPPQFKLATIVRNRRQYPVSTSEADIDSVFRQLSVGVPADYQLRREVVRSQLFPRVRGNFVWAGRLKHPNKYVDKVTIRPTSPSWLFNLIFVRAASDKQIPLTEAVRALIQVKNDRIIPRAYKITGEFDYLIPAYTTSEVAREDIESLLARP